MHSLDQALRELADGNRSRFDEVYRVAWPRVLGLCTRMLAGDPEAEDVAQKALLSVFERASDYDPDRGRAITWILGIAGWEVRSHRRRQVRSRVVTGPSECASANDLEEELLQRGLLAAVQVEIGRLSPADQQTLHAMMLDRPVGAAFRKRLSRALGRLRASWRNTHGT